jgi:hypothetical protein
VLFTGTVDLVLHLQPIDGTEAGLRQIVDEGRHNELRLVDELRRHQSFIDKAASGIY